MIDDLLHIFYPRSYTLSNGKVVKEKFNWTPYITIIVIIFSLLCAKITGVKLSVLRDMGISVLRNAQTDDSAKLVILG